MIKKGVSTFPFLLIFVLIAGAVILMFFLGFGKDIFSFSKFKTQAEVSGILEKQLDAFMYGNDIKKQIILPKKPKPNIDIFCNNKKRELIINFNEAKNPTQKLIFAPKKLTNNIVSLWTLSWDFPFKIDNIYYLADKETFFYFDEPPQSPHDIFIKSRIIKDEFPKQPYFNKLSSIPTITNRGKYILIFFNKHKADNYARKYKKKNNVNVIYLDIKNNDKDTKIYLYEKGSQKPPINFLGNPMIYAAIFARNYTEYKCIENIAIQRLKMISEIYKAKAKKLQSKVQDSNNKCNTDYSTFINQIEDFKNNPTVQTKESLDILNKNIERLHGCPKIFLSAK